MSVMSCKTSINSQNVAYSLHKGINAYFMKHLLKLSEFVFNLFKGQEDFLQLLNVFVLAAQGFDTVVLEKLSSYVENGGITYLVSVLV